MMLTEMTWDEAHATNSELEEMGLPQPCDCRDMVEGSYWRKCPDCGFYEELPEVATC